MTFIVLNALGSKVYLMHFLPSVSPNAETHYQELLSKTVADYELLDEFFYNLTNEDFSAKYATFFLNHSLFLIYWSGDDCMGSNVPNTHSFSFMTVWKSKKK